MVIVGSSGSRASVPDSFSKKLLERPITREVLIGIKTRGLRRRLWYCTLSRMERGLVDLTIRWVDNVRNRTMTKVLLQILEKLLLAVDHGIARVLAVGRSIAMRASKLAVRWGYNQAHAWRFNESLWRGLGELANPRREMQIP